MAQFLSVGDILMLSNVAWKIGRAFAAGKKSAPSEFAEVESESNGLSEALKLVAETLYADESLLSSAESETRVAVRTILDSAGRTLSDLDSFVDRYHVIKKKQTSAGFTVERTWSEVVVANYKTMKWTTEGGNIQELRNMLSMHATSINLTMQALQTRSLARLERTVLPMAKNIAGLHETVHGDLSVKLNDVHRIIMTLANSTPSLNANLPQIEAASRTASLSSNVTLPLLEGTPSNNGGWMNANDLIQRQHSYQGAQLIGQPSSSRHDSAQPTPVVNFGSALNREERAGAHGMDLAFESGSPTGQVDDWRLGGRAYTLSPTSSLTEGRRSSQMSKRESATLPKLFNSIQETDVEQQRPHRSPRSSPDDPRARQNTYDNTPRPLSQTSTTITMSPGSFGDGSLLPPPARPHDDRNPPPAATPLSVLSNPTTRPRTSQRNSTPSVRPMPASIRPMPPPTINTTSFPPSPPAAQASSPPTPYLEELTLSPSTDEITQPRRNSAFERALFRNAAILCDVPSMTIEYAQKVPNEPDPRFDTEMVELCSGSRVCAVRKRENREHGGTQVLTSIWVLSNDGEVRCQLKLPETAETVPYGSSFEACKVSLSPPDGPSGELVLRFHGPNWTGLPARETRTNWINYIFTTPADAAAFQGAVFGRKLLAAFHTSKTTVLHEGFKGAFAFEEQFANIEMLRLWEEDGTTSGPSAQGGVLALLHMSSNFGSGWARWWMNSSKLPARVKDDGLKWAKVKGIEVSATRPLPVGGSGPQSVKGPLVKKVTGVRLEFRSEGEKNDFLKKVGEVQGRLLPLPPI